ncbi:MAG: 3-dehydroquinate synthase [Dehalococcoidia bacterium]|nr:MAG: 3-dehydroquinate synthase [Dehalococcoidia bacterium]
MTPAGAFTKKSTENRRANKKPEEIALSQPEKRLEIPFKITVTRAWSVYLGRGLAGRIGDFVDLKAYSSLVLVTDETTDRLYGEPVAAILAQSGKKVLRFSLPVGEIAKSPESLAEGYTFLMENGVDRSALLVILGGGVPGDAGGYLAASYLRGIDYIQVPTTLLAQVDSAIGGKVGVNFGGKKNMVGSFYQPKTIIADVDFLKSLPPQEMRNGLAEILKYGLAMDKDLFERLEHKKDADFKAAELIPIIERCAALKAKVVMADETERTGARAILNFGHTIGHALEAASNLEGQHGAAVSFGMVVASRISARLGMLSASATPRIEAVLKKFGLPVHAPQVTPGELLANLKFDKKTSGGEPRWVLLAEIGRGVVNCKVPQALVSQVLAEVCR